MENGEETTYFVPLVARLDRLDRVLQILEENHGFSRRDSCASENNNECITLSSALEEVQQQHKGTLLERLALLEKRVLELGSGVDEGNTSRSSSSTVEVSEKSGNKEMQDPPKFQAQERATSADRDEKEIKTQHKSIVHKNKSQKKWLWLLRLRC